jgi:homoserine kinase type II
MRDRPRRRGPVPTSCFFTAATAILQQNAIPVLVDCRPETLEIDLDAAKSLVTPRTKAILPVHMYGYPSNIERITEFADRHGLVIIEDACQSHGAKFRGQLMGTFGAVGCFSFAAPRKHINVGEGGMVVTNSDALAKQSRRVANKGKDNGWFTHKIMGFSYNLPEMSAIIGIQGVEELDRQVALRREVSDGYDAVLRGTELEVPELPDSIFHSYFRKVVLLPERFAPIRDSFVRAGEWENVSAKPPHTALHTIDWLRERTGSVVQPSFPVADRELPRVVDLEAGPLMSDVLRCYRITAAHEIDFELDLIDHLVSCGFPTPRIVRTATGERRVVESGTHAVLFDFVAGVAIDPQRRESLAQVAGLAARLHNVTVGRSFGAERSRSDRGRIQTLLHAMETNDVLARKAGADRLVEHLRSLLGDMAEQQEPALPSGALHHDFYPDNILVHPADADHDQSVAALIDFDESYAGPFVFDIASLLTYWAKGERDWFDVPTMRELLTAYQQVRAITPDERTALPLAVRVFNAADAAEYILRNYRKRPTEFELSGFHSLDTYYALTERDDWLRGLDVG